jgi:hypothetical protein
LVLLEYTGPQSGGPMPSWEVGSPLSRPDQGLPQPDAAAQDA